MRAFGGAGVTDVQVTLVDDVELHRRLNTVAQRLLNLLGRDTHFDRFGGAMDGEFAGPFIDPLVGPLVGTSVAGSSGKWRLK